MKSEPATQDNGQRGRLPYRASPRARRAARELGVDLSLVTGTGPQGRIVERDVIRFAGAQLRPEAPPPAEVGRPQVASVVHGLAEEVGGDLSRVRGTGPDERVLRGDVLASTGVSTDAGTGEAGAKIDLEAGLTGRLVPLGRKRKVTAEKMALAAHTVARMTLFLEVDMAETVRVREELAPVYQSQDGLHLSYSDLLILAASRSLREHPYMNARWTDQGIVEIDQVNVGLAVAVPDGLVVPVVKEADRKSLREIARATSDLAARARDGKLSLADLAGGTFTITNLGMYGIELFIPVVNPPEAAILGVGKIVERPVIRDGQVVARPRMALSLSVDHRVVDGAPAARFLARVQQLLEKPHLLL